EERIFADARGWFSEVHSVERYARAGVPGPFVQDNISFSLERVLRGLHFQNPNAQGKLVVPLKGTIWDVVVDIRRSSPTFGQWFGVMLVADKRQQIYVPPGFAHGFCVLSDSARVLYK